jgi:hypothetical protein
MPVCKYFSIISKKSEVEFKKYKASSSMASEQMNQASLKSNLDLDDITKMLVNKSRGYRTFAETDLGTIIAKKYLLTPPTDFGNGGFGPVGKALPQGSLTYLFSGSKSSELSPHAEALIDNVKETLENIQYGILKPEESEEEKNYKGNKDKIKHKEHFYKFLNRQGMSIRK